MTPSKKYPRDRSVPSPPVPMTIDPSLLMGEYRLGSGPLYQVVSEPARALPPLSVNTVLPLFFSKAVTNVLALPLLSLSVPLSPWKRPFSRSACTHGPFPVQPPKKHLVEKLTASMWPAPSSWIFA